MWRSAFAEALRPLSESLTASRYGLPSLDNAAYRALARQATRNIETRALLAEYLPRVHVDEGQVIDLFVEHPEVGNVSSGRGRDRATFVTMPGHGFRVELKQLAERAARIAVMRGDEVAATELDEFLTLASQGQLPGYEVVVLYGLAVESAVDLGPGTRLASYEEAIQRGLVRKRRPEPLDVGPDYERMRASVLFREMTWCPCLVGPSAAKDLGARWPTSKFGWESGPSLGVILDLLSLVTAQRIEMAEILSCAPDFVDVNPNLGPGSSTWFVIPDQWQVVELTSAQATEVREWLETWASFGAERGVLELGLARLVSSFRRHRGRFRLEDRVLDIAVALEVLYGLDSGELTHKLSTRAAHLLGREPERRVEVFDAVGRLYGARSRIVHGGGSTKPSKRRNNREDAEQVAQLGFEIGKDTLWKLLNRGTLPDWKKVVLSAE